MCRLNTAQWITGSVLLPIQPSLWCYKVCEKAGKQKYALQCKTDTIILSYIRIIL